MKRKVFFVTNGLPGGGAERVMSVVANYLDDRKYDVSFIKFLIELHKGTLLNSI